MDKENRTKLWINVQKAKQVLSILHAKKNCMGKIKIHFKVTLKTIYFMHKGTQSNLGN